MFKPMRKIQREIFDVEIETILGKAEYGVLATVNENGYPYALPNNYVYTNKAIYIHCAKVGQKLDNIALNSKVSFCVVGDTKVEPSTFSTKYESAIAFCTATLISDEEKDMALLKFIEKYSPCFLEEGKIYIEKAKNATQLVKLTIDHVTGKASI